MVVEEKIHWHELCFAIPALFGTAPIWSLGIHGEPYRRAMLATWAKRRFWVLIVSHAFALVGIVESRVLALRE
jgi:hypothetical protein